MTALDTKPILEFKIVTNAGKVKACSKGRRIGRWPRIYLVKGDHVTLNKIEFIFIRPINGRGHFTIVLKG